MCVFSPLSLFESLSSLLFSTKKKACKSCVFSLHHLIINLSLSSLLFSMKKFVYQSCFISNISLSKLNLFSFFVFYEEDA